MLNLITELALISCISCGFSTAKPSQDLLGLDLFGGNSSSASTPTGGNYSFPRENNTTPTPGQTGRLQPHAPTPCAVRRLEVCVPGSV